ncbi:MAG: universal stress protein [Planctomycetes bacterium]|nr:universal stress protein [Planctomycetota bacterium]
MARKMLHIFRNNPLGRENLIQSISFCRKVGNLELWLYYPEHTQCLIAFDSGVVTLDLDATYTRFRETAERHALELLAGSGLVSHKVTPSKFTSQNLEELSGEWDIMLCPRVISESMSRIGIGHIGRRVRALVKASDFPIFIASPCERPWQSIAAFFGGSDLGLRAVRQGLSLAEQASVPLSVFTQLEDATERECREKLEKSGVMERMSQLRADWVIWRNGSMEANLYDVPRDALVVAGAAGDSAMHELLFGSKLELIQRTLPNPLVIVGPSCKKLL